MNGGTAPILLSSLPFSLRNKVLQRIPCPPEKQRFDYNGYYTSFKASGCCSLNNAAKSSKHTIAIAAGVSHR